MIKLHDTDVDLYSPDEACTCGYVLGRRSDMCVYLWLKNGNIKFIIIKYKNGDKWFRFSVFRDDLQ